MYEAIIFDMDGVIVDTEYHYVNALRNFFSKNNVYVNEEQLYPLIGSSGDHFNSMISQLLGNEISNQQVEEKVLHYLDNEEPIIDYQAIFRKDIILILEYAKKNNLNLAVASSSTFDIISSVMNSCNIYPYFDKIISGDMFAESKPNPEIYLYTAKELGIEPEKCLAIEDSTYGIQAAKSAGMTVVGYREPRFPIDQSYADFLEDDMRGIYNKIVQLHLGI